MPFPDPVLHSLRQLVPCDVVTYHAQPGGGTPAIARAGEWCRDWTPQMREVDARTWHQDGLTPTWGARKVSDNLSRREFRRLELYDVSRLLGIEFTMRLWLDPDGADGARLEFDREEKDFDERDRAVLDLLLPHLARLRRQAAGRARDRASEAEQLTAREREILGLVAKGGRTSRSRSCCGSLREPFASTSRTRTRSSASTHAPQQSRRRSAGERTTSRRDRARRAAGGTGG